MNGDSEEDIAEYCRENLENGNILLFS